jgi:hypothetical protein
MGRQIGVRWQHSGQRKQAERSSTRHVLRRGDSPHDEEQPMKLGEWKIRDWNRNCGLDLDDMSLWRKITVKEAEGSDGAWAEWRALKAAIRPGDELYRYSTSADSWKHRAGRAGIALVRNGEVVAEITTMMN